MSELYKAIAGSPITYLATDVSAGQTTIAVTDDSVLPDAPNICTIGYGENIETIRYGAKSNGVLQNVTRGLEGTPRAWKAGTEVARFYTAYEHNAIIEAIIANKTKAEDLEDELKDVEENHRSHLAASVVDNVHGLKPVALWSGNAGEPGQLIYLSDSIDKFEKIVLWVSFSGQEFRDWYHKANNYIDLKGLNLSNDGASTYHQLYEMRITKTSNTILEITHNVMLTWSNNVSSITNRGDARLYGVLGVGKKE